MSKGSKFWNSVLNDWVEPREWQKELKVGDYYAIHPNHIVIGKQFLPAPPVYGQITSDEDCETGYFFVQAFSQWMPDGDTGEFCICDATHRLTEEQFKQAQIAGWPEDINTVLGND